MNFYFFEFGLMKDIYILNMKKILIRKITLNFYKLKLIN